MSLTREAVLDCLRGIVDPVGGKDIVTAGMVRALTVEGDAVRFVLEIDPARAARRIMTDDGMNTGILYRGNRRPYHMQMDEPATEAPDHLDHMFEI